MDRGRAETDEGASEETPPTKRIKTEEAGRESVMKSIELPREPLLDTPLPTPASKSAWSSPSCLSVASLLNPVLPPSGQTSAPPKGDGAGTHLWSSQKSYAFTPSQEPTRELSMTISTVSGLSPILGVGAGTRPLSSQESHAITLSQEPTRESSMAISTVSGLSEDAQVSVDFATAPSDPVELAIWVAEQIENFAARRAGEELTESEKKLRSLSHAPGVRARDQNDKGLDLATLAAKDKAREVGRLRKAKWRKKNAEANANNDLTCRISKRAKDIYGEHSSDEKTEFLNTELEKRKGRRTQKVKGQPNSEARFTGYDIPADLGAKLFTSGNNEVDREVEAAGILLINALHIVTFADKPPSNQDTAFALKSALVDLEIDSQIFVEALQILSADPTIMAAIAPSTLSSKSTSKASSRAASATPASMAPPSTKSGDPTPAETSIHASRSDFQGARISNGTEGSAFPAPQQARLRGGLGVDTDQPSEKDRQLQAINTATEILIEMNPDHPPARFPTPGFAYASPYQTPYQTPYPNTSLGSQPIPITMGVNVQSAPIPPGPNGSSVAHTVAAPQPRATQEGSVVKNVNGGKKPTASEEAQADLLLHFAGLGSVTSSDDGRDNIEKYGNSKAQPDAEVEILLQHICRVLESRDAIAGTAQARALRFAMSDIGVNKNVVIPKGQSQAISRLYNLLANRAKALPALGVPFPPFPYGSPVQGPGSARPQYPVGPAFHGPGKMIDDLPPGSGFFDPHGRFRPFPPGPYIAHPNGVFSSPHYPGGYIVPQSIGFPPPHPGPHGHRVLPAHGSGSRLDPIVLPDPAPRPQAKPFVPSNMPPPPLPTRITTARGKTAEEARKVRTYGFPPLPGSRPGENASSMKRKAGE